MRNENTYCALIAVRHDTKASTLIKSLKSLRHQSRTPDEIRLVFELNIPQQLITVIEDNPDIVVDCAPVSHADPQRLAKCLNYSLNRTQCSHLIKVDVDDFNLPWRIQETSNIFDHEPKIKLVGSQLAEWDEANHRPVGMRQVPTKRDKIERTMLWRNSFNGPTVTVESAALIEVGGFPLVTANEDYACWAQLVHSGFNCMNSDDVWVVQSGGLALLKRRNRLAYRLGELRTLAYLTNRRILPKYSAIMQGVRNFFGRNFIIIYSKFFYPIIRNKWPKEISINEVHSFFND